MITIDEHPLLDHRVLETTFSNPIGELQTPDSILKLLTLDDAQSSGCPVSVNDVEFEDSIKPKIRDLLRHGGYKPTGRGKPASEYLRQAVAKETLGPINLPVDICNVVSLHSGLPISVVDFDRINEPLRIGIAPPESEYVFNATGQTIKISGLLCLFDETGPCANGVKDSQRTKTSPQTTKTVSIIWGTNQIEGRTEATANWYRELLELAGAKVSILNTK